MNVRELNKRAELVDSVLAALSVHTARKFSALCEEQGDTPVQSEDYEAGFKHGQNATLKCFEVTVDDFTVEDLMKLSDEDFVRAD